MHVQGMWKTQNGKQQGTWTNKTDNFIITLVLMHVFFNNLEIEKWIVAVQAKKAPWEGIFCFQILFQGKQ